MKITAVRTVVVWGPRRPAYGGAHRTALGPATVSEYAIVFVDTDAGITGIGEISSVFKRRGRLLARDVDLALGPAVMGQDPFRIAYLVHAMDRALDGVEEAKAGLEMACWDIVGKALNTPVYNLLGGKVRDRVPLSYSVPFGEPNAMAEYALARVREGHRTVKVKVGNDPAIDIEAVRRVREAIGPEVRLRVDANMAWSSAKEAIRLIRAHGGLGSRAGGTAATAAGARGDGRGAPRDRRAAHGGREHPDGSGRHGGDPPRRGRHRERLRHRGGRAAQRPPASSRCARRPACRA